MKDVSDYLIRMAVAVFLCPVAVAFWLVFSSVGFSLGGLMQLLGEMAQRYAEMGMDQRQMFLLELLFGWAALAFVVMLISFVVKRPHFGYVLGRKEGKSTVAVTQ